MTVSANFRFRSVSLSLVTEEVEVQNEHNWEGDGLIGIVVTILGFALVRIDSLGPCIMHT